MIRRRFFAFVSPALLGLACCHSRSTAAERLDVRLDDGWHTAADEHSSSHFDGFERAAFDDQAWKTVSVPHNWDAYEGNHLLVHGDRHGYAWYRRSFDVPAAAQSRRIFLFFEGIGTYATVWVNGTEVGRHAGGRTTFTLDITDAARPGAANLLAVRADHPDGIKDVPWVCGGSVLIPGFSEGTQPMGIFRPVHLVVTDPVRVEPFGVFAWNDANATAETAVVHIQTEVKNCGTAPAEVELETRVLEPGDPAQPAVATLTARQTLAPGQTATIRQDTPALHGVHLWSLDDPHLYTVASVVRTPAPHAGGTVPSSGDAVTTTFGIRTIRWPSNAADPEHRFLLNGHPVFINGIAEYEHNLGNSHAFTDEQVRARVFQIRGAGFNAFRDAHQPHNLRYQEYWDQLGVLWWPQFAAHIWFDTPAFRENFKILLRDWMKERRNSPSVVLWGLENESSLPKDFSAECCALMREIDPTATIQRKITTCNGAGGADWAVPQNWSGTYGGDPEKYAADLKRELLVGEYGAWRSLGYHTEGGFKRTGPLSEDRMTGLMELKIRLGESVRDESCGQFMWLFETHENPGRAAGSLGQQRADGIRLIDQIGPANNKGLWTIWGEPTDAYYLYRSNYVSAANDPMVEIACHTWPNRWNAPGKVSGIVVYSNCDEVELFNDYRHQSLGRLKRGPIGTHFQWDNVSIGTNVLYAEGYVKGRLAATDRVVLQGLPHAPHEAEMNGAVTDLLAAAPGQHYLYRVNCGGLDYRDSDGQSWSADRDDSPGAAWGSRSWGAAFKNVPPEVGSQRETTDPIVGTRDQTLFQTFRYGRDQLQYRFAVPDGDYQAELYFTEPWYGRGGAQDCAGWRLFDMAINGATVLHDLDLWKESGYCRAVKKVVAGRAEHGNLIISFPRVAVGQAVISAIAISTAAGGVTAGAERTGPGASASAPGTSRSTPDWERLGPPAAPAPDAAPPQVGTATYSARSARRSHATVERSTEKGQPAASAALDGTPGAYLEWKISLGIGGTHRFVFRYAWAGAGAGAGAAEARLTTTDDEGTVLESRTVKFGPTGGASAWMSLTVPGGLNLNAGHYRVRLMFPNGGEILLADLTVD